MSFSKRILAPRDPLALVIACVALVVTVAPGRLHEQLLDRQAGPALVLAGIRGQRAPPTVRVFFFQWVAEQTPPEAVFVWMPWPPLVTEDPLLGEISAAPIANYYLHPRLILSPYLATVPAPSTRPDATMTCSLWDQHRREVTWLLQHERYAPHCPGMEVVRVLERESWRLVQLTPGT